MPEDTGQARQVSTGLSVFTLEGEQIGHVKEVREGYFKVDARMQPDYWLQSQFVESVGADRVTMQIKHDDLDSYKLDEPGVHAEAMASDTAPPNPAGGYPETTADAVVRSAEQRNI